MQSFCVAQSHNTGEAIINTHSHSTVTSVPELPKEKQTSLALYVTCAEAYGKWAEAPEAVKILDVRTPEEYIFVGHPEMAVNIPLAFQTHHWSEEKGYFDVAPNPEFVAQVTEWAKPLDVLLVMCRSGGRSAMAVNLLAQAGFKNAYNIIDGMEGDLVKDPDNLYVGKRMKNGWKNSGLPWTYDVNPDLVRLPNENN
jgi:rhodanese-related sulfurtransferase